jgi:hypothetical protein
MMKLKKPMASLIAMSVLATMLYGCQKPEGPAEQAGKEIDKATDTAGQKIEQAGEAVQDTAKGKK